VVCRCVKCAQWTRRNSLLSSPSHLYTSISPTSPSDDDEAFFLLPFLPAGAFRVPIRIASSSLSSELPSSCTVWAARARANVAAALGLRDEESRRGEEDWAAARPRRILAASAISQPPVTPTVWRTTHQSVSQSQLNSLLCKKGELQARWQEPRSPPWEHVTPTATLPIACAFLQLDEAAPSERKSTETSTLHSLIHPRSDRARRVNNSTNSTLSHLRTSLKLKLAGGSTARHPKVRVCGRTWAAFLPVETETRWRPTGTSRQWYPWPPHPCTECACTD
jgi:hypothetical protein